MEDDNTGLGWRDPYVVIGAVTLAAIIAVLVYNLIAGHWLPGRRDHGGSPPASTSSPAGPSRSGSQPAPTEPLPYQSCAAAARDGRYNIHIGDPAYNAALDRNHDGIACERH